MPGPVDKAYTSDHQIGADGSVTFRCSQDVGTWPWLELPAWHPVAMQTINYWVSVEASAARGTFDRDKWSALIWMDWGEVDFESGMPARGLLETTQVDDDLGFLIRLFDGDERQIYASRGKGVIFRNRDFEGWRKKAKTKVAARSAPADFAYADPGALGIGPEEYPLISPLAKGSKISAQALVTPENGLPPSSKYMSGSGDHVNATHLAEVGRQFVALLTENPQVRFPSGEISFTRYVELNAPFSVTCEAHDEDRVVLAVEQDGKPCTTLELNLI